MATKKQAPRSSRASSNKASKPAKHAKPSGGKSSAKPSRTSGSKPVSKKSAQKIVKKSALKKSAPAPKKPMKKAVPAIKKVAPPQKNDKKPAPVAKKVPVPEKKHVPVVPSKHTTPATKPEIIQPEKKPAVSAPTHQEIKPAIKPLVKPVPKKEPPPKPAKFVVPKTSTTKAVKYDPDFTRSVLDTPLHVNTGPTMRYSDTELIEFRELIHKKLETAKKELAYLQGLITRKDEGGDMEDGRYMTMEDGSMSMEREQLSQMASRQIQFIDHLEKAMMRIENKTYGICRVTGRLIDKARLRAVPHATLSIEAKQLMNK